MATKLLQNLHSVFTLLDIISFIIHYAKKNSFSLLGTLNVTLSLYKFLINCIKNGAIFDKLWR